jgi:hypothetical protein
MREYVVRLDGQGLITSGGSRSDQTFKSRDEAQRAARQFGDRAAVGEITWEAAS